MLLHEVIAGHAPAAHDACGACILLIDMVIVAAPGVPSASIKEGDERGGELKSWKGNWGSGEGELLALARIKIILRCTTSAHIARGPAPVTPGLASSD